MKMLCFPGTGYHLTALFLTVVLASGCKSETEAAEVAILVTDWGAPEGFDANYYSQIGYRGSRGPSADPNIPENQQQCTETFVGVYPYQSAIGIMPWMVSYDESTNDTSGIYQVKQDGSYVNVYEPSIVMSAEEAAQYDIIPAIDYEAELDRGRAFFGLDKRLGDTLETGAVNHLDGYFKIKNGGDGVNDLDESYNLYWVRLVAMMALGEEAYVNPYTAIMEEELEAAMYALYGGLVDIRFGMYEAVEGLTRREDDVAVDFADEGFTKMLLTRETTDNNNYANHFMTYGYIQRALCQNGYGEQVDIKQVRQVGRTPEYNTMLVNTLKPAFARIEAGSDVSVIYATYGLPYPTNRTAEDYIQEDNEARIMWASNHPWAKEVFAENAYNNFLSARAYIQQAFDADFNGNYNLNFNKTTAGSGECTNPDCRMNSLFGYSLYPPYPYFGYPDYPDRYQSIRDNIESLKSEPIAPKHILIALSHWYYNSGDTALALRDMNNLPISAEEDIVAGDFIMEWCEGPTTSGPDDTKQNREYIETYVIDQRTKQRGNFKLDPETGECAQEGYIHIVIAEAFDEQMEDFSRGYAARIRGGVERFGVFPSKSLGLILDTEGRISKQDGGTVVSDIGASKGARIEIPADPDIEKPDDLLGLDMYQTGYDYGGTSVPMTLNLEGVKALNDPTDRWEAAWWDFTLFIGTQEKALNPENSSRKKINLPDGPSDTNIVTLGVSVYFGPYRTLFNAPATITLPYNTQAVSDPGAIRPFVYNDITGDYDQVYPVAGGIDYGDDNNNMVVNDDGTASFSVQTLGIYVLAECPGCKI